MPLCGFVSPCPALGGGWDLAPVTRKGLHRLQALCRWVAWGPTGHWAAIPPDFPLPCRSCRSAMSAPALRLLLCRHALVPSACFGSGKAADLWDIPPIPNPILGDTV